MFPHLIADVEENANKELLADFHGEKTGFVQIGPRKYLLPVKYRQYAAEFYNFEPRSDDVWIVTYPRSGTTLMQEMLWLLAHDLNYEEASKKHVFQRSPFLEFNIVVHDEIKQQVLDLVKGDDEKTAAAHAFGQCRISELRALEPPRIIKSHLPFSLLNPKLLDSCKVVYSARNPKDVAVSYYHHNRLFTTQGYVGEFPKYWQYMERDLLPWSPYWEHIREAWELRNHPNLLFVFYEDLVQDMQGSIRKVATFLNKSLTEEQVVKLAEHLSFENFRNNPMTSVKRVYLPGLSREGEQDFIRKGKNNGWVDYFTPEMNASADKWIEENMSRIPGFHFPEIVKKN